MTITHRSSIDEIVLQLTVEGPLLAARPQARRELTYKAAQLIDQAHPRDEQQRIEALTANLPAMGLVNIDDVWNTSYQDSILERAAVALRWIPAFADRCADGPTLRETVEAGKLTWKELHGEPRAYKAAGVLLTQDAVQLSLSAPLLAFLEVARGNRLKNRLKRAVNELAGLAPHLVAHASLRIP